jgi:stringent starvation protein A
MSVIANRRSIMNLFSKPTCIHSHRTRIVLAEKNINIDITSVVGPDLPEDLMDINPYHTLPTLIDRDLVLYDSRVIIEYLDERFPHPPLMPVDPVTRAQFRMALYRIEQDWYTLADKYAVNGEGKLATKPKKMLKESILAAVDLFSIKDYFISDDFSLVDCTIAPLLWRLPEYGIDLGQNAAAIDNYMDRVFDRPSFRESLSELEQEMRL